MSGSVNSVNIPSVPRRWGVRPKKFNLHIPPGLGRLSVVVLSSPSLGGVGRLRLFHHVLDVEGAPVVVAVAAAAAAAGAAAFVGDAAGVLEAAAVVAVAAGGVTEVPSDLSNDLHHSETKGVVRAAF